VFVVFLVKDIGGSGIVAAIIETTKLKILLPTILVAAT